MLAPTTLHSHRQSSQKLLHHVVVGVVVIPGYTEQLTEALPGMSLEQFLEDARLASLDMPYHTRIIFRQSNSHQYQRK